MCVCVVCVWRWFALMEIQLFIVLLLSSYELSVDSATAVPKHVSWQFFLMYENTIRCLLIIVIDLCLYLLFICKAKICIILRIILRKKTYEERLKVLGIYPVHQQRLRGDLIETYKILTGKERVDSQLFFQMAAEVYNLRGHSMKLYVPRCAKTVQKTFFIVRVCNSWNSVVQRHTWGVGDL